MAREVRVRQVVPGAERHVGTRQVLASQDAAARLTLGSSWAVLEGKITIVGEAASHEKNRRDGRLLRSGMHEPPDISSGLLA
ncbi:MAG TPA: hypothetical protein VJN18_02580, partial [Polyangiaceae bacterium]|nr:hypothetical protein [Polyangiaceae bacterium]